MPGFGGTGPMGLGPQTEGGFGYCNPEVRRGAGTGFVGRGFGPGFGRGCGRGFGRARGFDGSYIFADFPQNEAPQDEQARRNFLLAKESQLENELAAVKRSLGKEGAKGEDA